MIERLEGQEKHLLLPLQSVQITFLLLPKIHGQGLQIRC